MSRVLEELLRTVSGAKNCLVSTTDLLIVFWVRLNGIPVIVLLFQKWCQTNDPFVCQKQLRLDSWSIHWNCDHHRRLCVNALWYVDLLECQQLCMIVFRVCRIAVGATAVLADWLVANDPPTSLPRQRRLGIWLGNFHFCLPQRGIRKPSGLLEKDYRIQPLLCETTWTSVLNIYTTEYTEGKLPVQLV